MTSVPILADPAWLEGGPEGSIVLSSRVRLARNLRGHPFTHRANPDERAHVFETTREAIAAAPSLAGAEIVRVDRTSSLDRQYLVERHLVSPDLAAGSGPRGIAIGDGETTSVMINEEDHLRIQSVRAGLDLTEAWKRADRIDDELDAVLDLAYSKEWGYLTACPTNTGTGLRASVLIHLPALMLTKQISKVLRGISQVGLAVRGMFGEGTEVMGNFFQISNQTTLGTSEPDTLGSLDRVARQILDHEKSATEVLLKNARLQVEDKVFRAYGILGECRVIASQEALSLVSALRFGLSAGLIDRVDLGRLNRLMIETLPAHLQKRAGGKLDQVERDYRRAELVRGVFSS
ncbi:MAG: protein arginine kinase [Candidatus Latescibacterota bacterium]|nr:MAG: protein arginine kinase [Candidatus Latescibacterota bacterium]